MILNFNQNGGTALTVENVKKQLQCDEMAEAVLIGNEQERENYYPAITHLDKTKGRVTYDYDLLVECFANQYLRWNSGEPDYDRERAITDAIEWIDYNVVRSLPYWGEHAPLIK